MKNIRSTKTDSCEQVQIYSISKDLNYSIKEMDLHIIYSITRTGLSYSSHLDLDGIERSLLFFTPS
jgi:hypothetical protein